eukprot:gene718-4013_t
MSDEKKIEEIPADTVEDVEDQDDPDDNVPDLEEAPADADDEGDSDPSSKQSRSEKKARKALSKLGLVPVENIERVAIRKTKNVLFVFQKPDVLKAPGSDTFIIFGEAKFEDLSQSAMMNAAEKLVKQQKTQQAPAPEAPVEVNTKGVEADDKDTASDIGVSEKDVGVVANQAKVSREKAIETLKKHNGDIVGALMGLNHFMPYSKLEIIRVTD